MNELKKDEEIKRLRRYNKENQDIIASKVKEIERLNRFHRIVFLSHSGNEEFVEVIFAGGGRERFILTKKTRDLVEKIESLESRIMKIKNCVLEEIG